MIIKNMIMIDVSHENASGWAASVRSRPVGNFRIGAAVDTSAVPVGFAQISGFVRKPVCARGIAKRRTGFEVAEHTPKLRSAPRDSLIISKRCDRGNYADESAIAKKIGRLLRANWGFEAVSSSRRARFVLPRELSRSNTSGNPFRTHQFQKFDEREPRSAEDCHFSALSGTKKGNACLFSCNFAADIKAVPGRQKSITVAWQKSATFPRRVYNYTAKLIFTTVSSRASPKRWKTTNFNDIYISICIRMLRQD